MTMNFSHDEWHQGKKENDEGKGEKWTLKHTLDSNVIHQMSTNLSHWKLKRFCSVPVAHETKTFDLNKREEKQIYFRVNH